MIHHKPNNDGVGINVDTQTLQQPVGRFAPSPTGRLHLGSLTTAIASYCHIKSLTLPINQTIQKPATPTSLLSCLPTKVTIPHAQWLLRIEDVDRQRCKAEFSDAILYDLTNLGLQWDGDVVYQSQRTEIYDHYIEKILAEHIYACECSRKNLKDFILYPRHCLQSNLERNLHKLRICLPNHSTGFCDGIQNMQWQNPQTSLGDMVIRRDQNSQYMINYILAVSIDDGLQNISHVMRGLDILPMTSAQIAIMKLCHLPTIDHWYHLPLVQNSKGQKLSKQNLAQPIDTSSEKSCVQLIDTALQLLKQPSVTLDTPARMLKQAVSQWTNTSLFTVTAMKERTTRL